MNARALFRELTGILAPVSGARDFEARQLLHRFCALSTKQPLPASGELPPASVQACRGAAARRLNGEPLQYLLGEWSFYGRSFCVGEGVLIPRPDTEALAEAALSVLKGRVSAEAADLCSGSGCLAVTLALEGNAHVTAVEKSPDALAYLRGNTARHSANVTVISDDVLAPAGEYPRFDVIVSNPPYLTSDDMRALQTEVRREPEMALFGGEDGLDFYRAIPRIWKKYLKPGGWLFFEIGLGQEKAVGQYLKNECFENVCFSPDLCAIIRVVGGRRGE